MQRELKFPSPTLAQRYWSHIDVRGPDECWPWTACTEKGYGKIWVGYDADGRVLMRRSTRVGWELVNGEGPGSLDVLHSCDNPPCHNPAHWNLGTHAENMREMADRGRAKYMRGSAVGTSKLTEDQVREIRRLFESGHRQCDIARSFGVTQANISEIVKGKTWKHLLP